MMIKNFGVGVEQVWDGLRPMTKKMLVGVLQTPGNTTVGLSRQKFEYDAHADWELSSLLTALDKQETSKDPQKRKDADQLSETIIKILETRSASAEVFIQLAIRALNKHDYAKLDKLTDGLAERYTAAEVAEIIRQTDLPQIKAVAFETLALFPPQSVAAFIDDPLYSHIALFALEQMAIEYNSDEAKHILDQVDLEPPFPEDQNGS